MPGVSIVRGREKRMAPSDNFTKSAWVLASIAVVVAALYLAKGVLVPLTLAVLLSFVLSPVCDWFERHGLGRLPAVLVTAFLSFAIFSVAAWMVVVQMTNLAPKMPEYQNNIQAKFHSVDSYLRTELGRITRTAEEIGQSLPPAKAAETPQGSNERPYWVHVLPSPATPLQVIGGLYGTLLDVLGSTLIVALLVVFFLAQREDLRDRFIRLFGHGQMTLTTQTLEDAATRVSRYLSTQFLINLAFGVSVGIGLSLIGIPNSILCGILATTMRFVPYIGPWIAAAMPLGLSLAISTNWATPLITFGLFVVLEAIVSNVLEPWLYGKNTGVSPVAVLVAAVFWTWLWGSVGLLLATPLTVCLLVIGKHVPQLSFLDILLGNEPVFELKTRIYQRLLAGDLEQAVELIEESLEHSSLAELYDTVLVPALALAESDRRRGDIDEDRQKFIFQSLKDTIEDLGERQRELPAPQANGEAVEKQDGADLVILSTSMKPYILLLPARNEADEIAATMLAHLVESTGFRAEVISATVLAGQIGSLIAERRADVVCISAMPPVAATHSRSLCKRLRGKTPDERLIVGLWNAQGDLDKARPRIGCGAAVRLVATLSQAQEQIQVVLRPLLAPRTPPAQIEVHPVVPEVAHS